jgi:hypothetical protein
LREFFDGQPLLKQLVEAYIIGFPTYENQFQFLKVSESADAFGGYISYSTFGQDTKIATVVPEYTSAVSVNPLNWSTEKVFVSGAENTGSLSKKSDEIIKTDPYFEEFRVNLTPTTRNENKIIDSNKILFSILISLK